MKKIVLIGSGGHCKVIIDIIKSTNEYEIVGAINKEPEIGKVLGIPIIAGDDELEELYSNGINNAFICIGALNNINLRNMIYKKLKKIGFESPILIHNNSIVSEFACIGEGTCIMPGAVVNASVEVGKNCIINTGCIIEHDCKIGDNVHISPRACLGGEVIIGENSHIGIGSTIIQGIHIGSNVTIGAGAVVINDINDNSTAVGIPAKIVR